MKQPTVSFAVPGDIDALTGGYIYEKQVMLGLRRAGWRVEHLALPGDFPDPSRKTVEEVSAAFVRMPADQPVLLDGFLPGAMPPSVFSQLAAPFVAICHHPLGYEKGLSAERAAYLCAVERENLSRAAHIVVPSPHTGKVLVEDFGLDAARISVAQPGVTAPPADAANDVGPLEILCVAQFVPRKGQDILVEALARIADLPWRAHLVGQSVDAAYAQQVRSRVAALGLADRIHFHGQQSPEALGRRFGAAHIFALPSYYEGYGMVFAEALAAGLPIVACAAGAVPDTVPPDAGQLVPPGDPVAFAQALQLLISDEGVRKRYAVSAARHGAALPTWDDTAAIVAQALRAAGDYRANCSGA